MPLLDVMAGWWHRPLMGPSAWSAKEACKTFPTRAVGETMNLLSFESASLHWPNHNWLIQLLFFVYSGKGMRETCDLSHLPAGLRCYSGSRVAGNAVHKDLPGTGRHGCRGERKTGKDHSKKRAAGCRPFSLSAARRERAGVPISGPASPACWAHRPIPRRPAWRPSSR
jgi:hypothetical protein